MGTNGKGVVDGENSKGNYFAVVGGAIFYNLLNNDVVLIRSLGLFSLVVTSVTSSTDIANCSNSLQPTLSQVLTETTLDVFICSFVIFNLYGREQHNRK